ncbi:hypothetical protein J7382_11725 [Shimia sp. R11_0]|nr:hypothetical protein [Shimia sp. R11_0]
MRYPKHVRMTLMGFLLVWGLPAGGQAPDATGGGPEAFASENAILDTSIPFAIGAREARQALRGSFGWPSFQEGLVEGVYFRFDPDGYARFAPTPRLDTDVFEVICRPRTYACAARKSGMEVFLTERGQLQLKLEDALAGDTFYVMEGVSEIQVPERILQPLDVQLELLLGAGGDLVTRRGGVEVGRVSLKGFSAVTAYLRWIAARQDYSVLPRGWPVPNAEGAGAANTMTQAASWNSPMPQPQVLAPEYLSNLAGAPVARAPATTAAPIVAGAAFAPAPVAAPAGLPPVPATAHAGPMGTPSELGQAEALRAEIETLKHIILQQGLQSSTDDFERSQEDTRVPMDPMTRPSAWPVGEAENTATLAQLSAAIAAMQTQIENLRAPVAAPSVVSGGASQSPQAALPMGWPSEGAAQGVAEGFAVPEPLVATTEGAVRRAQAETVPFLMQRYGMSQEAAQQFALRAEQEAKLRPETLTPAPIGGTPARSQTQLGASAPTQTAAGVMYHSTLVDQILAELENDLQVQGAPQQNDAESAVRVEDYVLLSQYFKSAALPQLQEMARQASKTQVSP